MSFIWKNEINRLAADELKFEHESRGLPIATELEMRKSLKNILKLESSGQFQTVDAGIAFDMRMQTIKKAVDELNSLLQDFTGNTDSFVFKRATALVCYSSRCISNWKVKNDSQKKGKNEVLLALHIIKDSFEKKVRRFNRNGNPSDNTVVDISALALVDDNLDDSSSSEEQQSQTGISQVHKENTLRQKVAQKTIPVAKWNLKFSGTGKLSLSAFLEQVEELRIARGLSKEELYTSALDLFTDRALVWYRANRRKAKDWSALEKLLREEFQSADYDEKLLEEIKSRTQGSSESIGMYLSVMETMFGRLSIKISEQQQLKILLRNLTPFYQNHLGLVDVSSKEQLLELGRKLEARRPYMENYKPPSRSKTTLEPDLAYMESDAALSLSTVQSPEPPHPMRESGTADKVTCYRCGQLGHRAIGCVKKGRAYCYICKKPGFTVRTCPDCSSSQRPMSSRTFQGNGRARQ